MSKKALMVLAFVPVLASAAPIGDYQFKSPSFNGVGYSSHVLTIENQEFTRRAQVQKDIKVEVERRKKLREGGY